MIPIERAPSDGLVDGYEWRQGDRLARIGSTPLRDILDFYYLAEDEGELPIAIVDAEGRQREFALDSDELATLAEAFAPMEFKTCAARCVFCFIDQNPAGLRKNLYVKDEDYRFSFLYGNYITLTALGRRGIARVIEQKLTPLYVSVHATDIEARTKLLGIKRRIDVMAILRQLVAAGIEVHTQIVLCPGWNDGEVLDATIADLATLHPGCLSISVVPVGLSDHREGLTRLDPVTPEIAATVLGQVEGAGTRLQAEIGTRLAYCSDEFYLLTGRPFPDLGFYEDLPQQDTGIGMCRDMVEELGGALDDLVAARSAPVTATVLTGELASEFFARDLQPLLSRIPWLDLRVVGIENGLYGKGITVAGLLCGRDFERALRQLPDDAGTVLLPDSPINHDGVFLDDMPYDELEANSPHPLRVARDGLVETLLELARGPE